MASPPLAPHDDGVHDAPHPNVRRLVLGSAAILLAIGTFGSNIGPAWWRTRPELLLVLSSRNRNLFFTVPSIDPVAYYVIGFFRILAAGVVLYFVGRWYGRRAMVWFEGQVGELPPIYRWIRSAIDRAGWLFVIWMPGSNIVCLMAGHRRMPPVKFTILLSIGIVLKLVVLWYGAKLMEDQVETILDWVQGYQWWIVAGLFALSFLTQGRRAAKNLPDVVEELEHPHEFPPENGNGLDTGIDTAKGPSASG